MGLVLPPFSLHWLQPLPTLPPQIQKMQARKNSIPARQEPRAQKRNADAMWNENEATDAKENAKNTGTKQVEDLDRVISKENHCEIERRRRNKMSTFLAELSDMLPTYDSSQRKPDKLTILKMAVAHMQTLKSKESPSDESPSRPCFLSYDELKHLVLEAADGFFFVVGCRSGTITSVTDTVTAVLNRLQSDWLGSNIYEQIHPDDVEKVKDQLSPNELRNTWGILDLKSGVVKKDVPFRPSLEGKRGFICRMKVGDYLMENYGGMLHRNSLGRSKDGQDYAVVHCSGFINMLSDSADEPSLVAVGRLQMLSTPNEFAPNSSEFMTRLGVDGEISFCDERVVNVVGYQPVDLLGIRLFDFVHPDDQPQMRESFNQVLALNGQTVSLMTRFRSKSGEFVALKLSAYVFLNPASQAVEYIVCTNTLSKTETMRNLGISGNMSNEAQLPINIDLDPKISYVQHSNVLKRPRILSYDQHSLDREESPIHVPQINHVPREQGMPSFTPQNLQSEIRVGGTKHNQDLAYVQQSNVHTAVSRNQSMENSQYCKQLYGSYNESPNTYPVATHVEGLNTHPEATISPALTYNSSSSYSPDNFQPSSFMPNLWNMPQNVQQYQFEQNIPNPTFTQVGENPPRQITAPYAQCLWQNDNRGQNPVIPLAVPPQRQSEVGADVFNVINQSLFSEGY